MYKFISFSLAFTLTIHGIAQTDSPQMAPGLKQVHSLFDSSMNPETACYRIPSIVTATNGDILVAMDERVPTCQDLRGNRDINIVIRRSADNGTTWSEIERIVDFPAGRSASDPSMIVDHQTGRIVLFYNYMDLDNEKEVYYLHVVKSADHGRSWTEPEDITAQVSRPEWHNDFKFITSGRGFQTSTGKLLHCMVNLNSGMRLFESDDHGESWRLIDTPLEPGDESKVVELADGSWMVNSRVNGKGMRYVHTSEDSGSTWKTRAEPALVDPGCNASIIRYSSVRAGDARNRLLFSNAKSTNRRNNLSVRISYDEGITWSEGKTIYPGSAAYSSMTILGNGDIGLVFENDYYTKATFVSFSLEWLTDGEDR